MRRLALCDQSLDMLQINIAYSDEVMDMLGIEYFSQVYHRCFQMLLLPQSIYVCANVLPC